MIRIALALSLAALTGCLDSIVDNPCEDGYTLVDDACVAEPDVEHSPDVDLNVDEPVPPGEDNPTRPPSMEPPGGLPPLEPAPPEPPPAEGLSPCPTCE